MDKDEKHKLGMKAAIKIHRDIKAFSVLCDEYSTFELAVMIGVMIKMGTDDPQDTYKGFSSILKDFMASENKPNSADQNLKDFIKEFKQEVKLSDD